MAFDSSFSLENLPLEHEIETMFLLQNSTPFPPPSGNPHFHPLNTIFHQYFQDHTLNVSYNKPPIFVVEGTSSSITNANDFYGMSTPCLGESYMANGSIGDFINPHSPVTFEPDNKLDALGDHHSGQVIWDFEQKITVQTAAVSSSSQPYEPPSLVSDEYVSMLKIGFEDDLAMFAGNDHWDTDHDGQRRLNMRVQWEDDGNVANTHKGQWTPEEDKYIAIYAKLPPLSLFHHPKTTKLVKEHGKTNWSRIVKSLHGRVGKQCRERWHNYLRPDIRKDSWTIEEEVSLIKAHQEVGSKWAEIANRLSGRSENNIKNHWNGTKRRRNLKKTEKPNDSDGSVLQLYIKMVTANEDAAKELNKSIRMNIF